MWVECPCTARIVRPIAPSRILARFRQTKTKSLPQFATGRSSAGHAEGRDSLAHDVPRFPITLSLERQGDRLDGSIQALLKSEVIFVRDESARAEW